MAEPSSSRATALEAARLLSEHKGEGTVVLDISTLSSFADYFVISTARSAAHLAGLHRQLTEYLHARGIRASNRHKSRPETGWVLVDCGDIVVHLMEAEQRSFYELERLWFRAETVSF
jgi:ribosome-associated protein